MNRRSAKRSQKALQKEGAGLWLFGLIWLLEPGGHGPERGRPGEGLAPWAARSAAKRVWPPATGTLPPRRPPAYPKEKDLLFFCPDALSKRKGAHPSPFSAGTLAGFFKPQRRRIYMADYIALSPRAALICGH